MSPSDDETCGHPTPHGNADTCSRTANYPDGRCYQHSDHTGDREAGGRPDKLNAQRQAKICELLADGHPIRVAAGMAGITEPTFHNWRKRGRQQDEGRFAEFLERTERARTEGQMQWEEKAFEFAKEAESFGACMEILRKRYPDDWYSTSDTDDDVGGVNIIPLSKDREGERTDPTQ